MKPKNKDKNKNTKLSKPKKNINASSKKIKKEKRHFEIDPVSDNLVPDKKAEESIEELELEPSDEQNLDVQPVENIDQESDLEIPTSENEKNKNRKKGIIYVSNIPKHMNVTRIREILGEYGKIGRVYLQPEKLPGNDGKKKKKRFARHFTEGWIEFMSKKLAKELVGMINGKQISTRKSSQFYDYIWSMKYLPRFKWTHLTERMNYEQAVHKQRLMNEVSQARRETTFFQNNLDKSEFIQKKEKRLKKLDESSNAQ